MQDEKIDVGDTDEQATEIDLDAPAPEQSLEEEIKVEEVEDRINVARAMVRGQYEVLEQAIEAIKLEEPSKLFIIGGGVVYRQAMELADEMMITLVHKDYEGDTYFPEYNARKWTLINEIRNYDLENKFSYSYLSYKA